MVEALVLFLCLSGNGCGAVSKAYYAYNPHIKVLAKHAHNIAEEAIGETALYAIPPVIAMESNTAYQIRITKNISFKNSKNELLFIYNLGF